MPMYYPDIESVRACCATMAQHKGEKKYTGIIPSTEQELVLARQQLAELFPMQRARYPDYEPATHELDSGWSALPSGFEGNAIYISGHNRIDDLFMFL